MTQTGTPPPHADAPADSEPIGADEREVPYEAPRLVRRLVLPVAIALVFFLPIAPTLPLLEFSGGSENLNVATVLEMHRTGEWLVPTLQGEARVQKPPLTAWLTAAAVRERTVAYVSDVNPAVRAVGERFLAWDVRWTALAGGCGMLIAVYALGTLLHDWRLGAVSALVCGSSIMFLRQARLSTTDMQLALWVTVANALLAWAVLRRRYWPGFVLGGVAVGLALMSKGPVALVQTILPIGAFVLWERFGVRQARGAASGLSAAPRRGRPWLVPLVVGVLLMLAIGVAWFAYVLLRSDPDALVQRWVTEVTREGATDIEADPWYNYLSLVPTMFPWSVFLVAGLVISLIALLKRQPSRLLMAVFLVVVPIVVMSFFKDRKERYLLPMAGPAAVVIAWGLWEHFRSWRDWTRGDTIVTGLHWLGLAVVAVGLPVVGMFHVDFMKTVEGGPWYAPRFAILSAVAGAALVVGGIDLHRRWRGGLVTASVLVMLLLQAVFMIGYRDSREGRSEMKPLAELIWQTVPDAQVVSGVTHKRIPSDLAIYLNRPTPTVAEFTALPTGDVPQVLILYQRKRTDPPATPAGWTFLGKVPRDDNWWHAFVRPAGSGAAPPP
jgi:4-amino-4-deoxy-L-arabinose transferase-like glycosyltransferase